MISIIIPTLNEEKNLAKILDNIKEQNFNNYEIIISDGNSNDKTEEVAIKYNCLFIKSKKRSPAHQRNIGAKQAKYNILLFLDADSQIPKEFINKSINEFKKRKLEVASFYLRFNSHKFIYKIYNIIYNFLSFVFQYFKPLSVGAAIMVKRDMHFKVNGFDESIYIGEDHDYALRIKKYGKFRMIKSVYFYFSPRRWKKEGHIRSIFKIIKMSIYILFFGPIRKKIVNYEFGNYN